jgi:hypothetical protein
LLQRGCCFLGVGHMDQGNMSDRIRLDCGSGTVQSDHQPHNHHRSLPPSSVSCPADLPSPAGMNGKVVKWWYICCIRGRNIRHEECDTGRNLIVILRYIPQFVAYRPNIAGPNSASVALCRH